jgi:phosphoribosyl 1,2-cyclic phosphodiesterase
MRFSVLASGSGGNVCYVETVRTRVLIDAGLSCRETIRRLDAIGVDPGSLDGLVITHEHTDHIRGAGPLARRFHLPVYLNPSTLRNGIRMLGSIPTPVPVKTGQTITVKDLFIETFTKCHDAADPMGLVLSSDGTRLGIITDLGRSTGVVEDRLRGCRALIVEFNHDENMLEDGPYPLELKRRIRGDHGHLSNRQAARLVRTLAHPDLAWVIPAHLSEINNEPRKALRAVRDALANRNGGRSEVLISSQDVPVPMLDL